MNIQGYYEELRHTYGPNFVEYIKEWKKLGITLERRKMQRNFLFNCKSSNVFPQHILNTCYVNVRCFSRNVQTKLEKSIQLFSKKNFRTRNHRYYAGNSIYTKRNFYSEK